MRRFFAGQQAINGVRTDLVDAWLSLHPEPRAGNEYVPMRFMAVPRRWL